MAKPIHRRHKAGDFGVDVPEKTAAMQLLPSEGSVLLELLNEVKLALAEGPRCHRS